MYTHNFLSKTTMTLFGCCLLLTSLRAAAQDEMVKEIPSSSVNNSYASTPAPLAAQRLIKLPTGSITPTGWLATMLQLQKNGLNGHLSEISAWLQKNDNAWLKEGGKWGWEEVPYWLRGYSDLAFILKDKDMLKEAQTWIEAILKSQRQDGNFGPVMLTKGIQDYWPNMLALWIMQNYYEYSNDKRVLDFMTRYFHYELSLEDGKFLHSYWENSRGGDNLWSVVWLYSRTKDPLLLQLGEKVHRCTADWRKSTQLPNWHNVNIAQCFREPATYYLFSKKDDDLRASYNDQDLIRRAFGQVPGGMFGADENARIGFIDPRQGTETCGFAEQMASDEIMMLVTGDQTWADNCEDVAFNSFPAALMPDMTSLRYITSPNMVLSDDKNHNPGIDNNGPFLLMNPFSSRCCQHNHGFAWPYYNDHLVMATPDNGLAVLLFNSCEARTLVVNKQPVGIKETTDYPFDGKITFEIQTKKDVAFPFYIRIPKWTEGATAKVNGTDVAVTSVAGQYLKLQRTWKKGDKIELNFPMKISTRTWQANKNSISVDYGPLTLSLKIKERYEKVDNKSTIISDAKFQEDADATKWPAYAIYPESPWNYALDISQLVRLVVKGTLDTSKNPFTQQNVPLLFKAKAHLVQSWQIDGYGLCGVLPNKWEKRDAQEQEVELIPMGAARLRISAFPPYNK